MLQYVRSVLAAEYPVFLAEVARLKYERVDQKNERISGRGSSRRAVQAL